MAEAKKRVPKRRFKEFRNGEEWELRELGQIAPLRGGYAFQSNEFQDGGIPIVKISNILTTGEVGGNFDFYTELKDDERFSLPDKAALLAMSGATTGKVAILSNHQNKKVYQNQRVGYFVKNNLVNYSFLSVIVRSHLFTEQLSAVLVAGAQPNVSSKEIDAFAFMFPKALGEQEKIGHFFSTLDTLITLHQRKLDKIKSTKKAYLSEMFPAEGETNPKRRFKGFSGEWEVRKLHTIYNKIRNAFVGTSTPYYVDEGNFYLESNNVKDGLINRKTEIFINDEFYLKQKENWLQTGDIAMVQSGHVGHAAVIPEELNNTAAHALIIFSNPKVDVNPYFLNYQYQTIPYKRAIDKIATGNTIEHILSSEMKEFNVSWTTIEEQNKIAEFYVELDKLITLHQQKLDKLKDLKKSYLNEMFI